MATVVTRLKVESQEFDSKLKRATEQMQHMEREVRRTGATFAYADKEELKFVRSLGSMQTQATTAKGKLTELKNTFTELSVQYQRLTSQEKASPFGQAMQQSIQQLKGRIGELQGNLNQAEGELSGFGETFKSLGDKIGIPIQSFTKFGVAAAGIGAALKVAGDALKQNEIVLDEWGRTKQAASSLYEGFLNALNTGDFSGYFQSMSNIVTAARDAYDALDELETFNAFNQINKQQSKTEFQQAIANFREGKGSKEDVVAARDALIAELQAQEQRERDAYKDAVLDIASTRRVNGEELYKLLSSGSYTDYEAIKELEMPTKSVYNSSTRSFYDVIDRSAATVEQKLGEMLRKLTDEELARIQALGAQADRTATEVEQVRRQAIRYGGTAVPMGGKSSVTEPEEVLPQGSIAEIEARISELNKKLKMAADQTTRDAIRSNIALLKAELDMMNSELVRIEANVVPIEVELAPTAEEVLKEGIDKMCKNLGIDPVKIGVTTDGTGTKENAKQTKEAWQSAANAVQSIGGALQQIEDPSAKVAGIVMEAVANIALGFSMASAQSAKGGAFAWIAATVSGLATMFSTISAIKSATSGNYAEGGIIPGNSYSGDNLVANVNAGELILNRSQQANIANQLQGGGFGSLQLQALISGESLRLVLANNASRRGGTRAQYAITNFR